MEFENGQIITLHCVGDAISISAQLANSVGVMSTTKIIGDFALDLA